MSARIRNTKHKNSARAAEDSRSSVSADDYGNDVLTVLRNQWESSGRENLDFDEFISGLAIVTQFMEREGSRNLRVKFDISASELRILLVLNRVKVKGGLRPTDLYRNLFISSGAVTKQLDRLSARDLIRREPDPRNSRGVRIKLTPLGQELVDKIVGNHDMVLPTMDRIFRDLSKSNRSQMLKLLHILTRGLRQANSLSPLD